MTLATPTATLPLDMDLIAQRILQLTEIATLEHLETLARSQAQTLVELAHSGDLNTRD